ncbi:MAG: phage holin family protein, partial [Anaerolineae bacterium]|nr:phage holin family protein [Anaerolineae bacterium]
GIVKPILSFLTCPLVILTLGLFIFVINGLMLVITEAILPDRLAIDGFGWAILGGIVMAIVGTALDSLLSASRN